jgi:polyene macrolide polyketide synthase
MARSGITPLPAATGLSLFDATLRSSRALAALVRLDATAISAAADTPPILRKLVRVSAAQISQQGDWPRRLGRLSPDEQNEALAELVLDQAASVLGHSGPADVFARRSFKDAGFDSLTGVELRNRLSAVLGLRLPATLVFDHPTPADLADWLRGEIAPATSARRPVLTELDRLATAILAAPPADEVRAEISSRMKDFLLRLNATGETSSDLSAASDDEIFEFIDNEL